jgi:serine protease Do
VQKHIVTILVSVTLSYGLFVATLPVLINEQKQSLEPPSMSIVEIAREVGPSVVGITAQTRISSYLGQERMAQSSGSGIIIKEDGYIVTNNHVIEGADNIIITLNTGEEYNAKIIGQDEKTDLAVVKIARNALSYATFGVSNELEVGEIAVAIGSPLGLEFAGTVTVGYISALNRKIEVEGKEFTLIQTDAAINPGNSGGALVNRFGQIIGINSVKALAAEGLGFAIPIDLAKPIIDDILRPITNENNKTAMS